MPYTHPSWAENRLLNFLNFARSAETIYQHPHLRDDPTSGSQNGYIIGQKVAQNIIDFRRQLPFPRYQSAEQLLQIKGLGKDKLNDLLHSFSTPADTAFRQMLFGEVLQDNWDLLPQSIEYQSDTAFDTSVSSRDHFRRVVATLCSKTQFVNNEAARRQFEISIHNAHLETFSESHLGAFQFAFWWYLFDQDNWFSYEMIKDVCERYLNYHGSGYSNMQFRLLHLNGYDSITDFRRQLIIPVVVNFAERKITVWDARLND